MKSLTSFALLLLCASCLRAQGIIQKMEYWIDNDLGFGAGTPIAGFASGANVEHNFAIPVSGNIPVGLHTLGIRSQDNNGRWSHTNVFPAFVFAPPSNANIERIEYWFDRDMGIGNTIPVAGVPQQPDINNFAITLPANLSAGPHTLGIRSRNADGKWSHTNFFPVYVSDSARGELTEVEFFWGVDPGFGNSPTDTDLSASLVNDIDFYFTVALPPDIGTGPRNLFVRSKGTRGNWSHTNRILVDTATTATHLVELTGIKVFPNPFVDEITISPPDDGKLRVVIYDQGGRLMGDVVVQGETTLDMSQLSSGTYSVFFWKGGATIYKMQMLKI